MQQQWCYSFDDRTFSRGTFDTKEGALTDAQKEGLALNGSERTPAVQFIYVAQCETPPNSRMFPDADIIIEHMFCQADDIAGEHASGYPDVSKEQQDDLTRQLHELLNNWCNENGVSPSFYSVLQSEKYDLATLALIK